MSERTTVRTYSELLTLPTFEDRFNYLKLTGSVGRSTFGYDRWINQNFYRSAEWKRLRDKIIIRDKACDLAMDGYELNDHIIIHHMNPILIQDIVDGSDYLLNPEFLVCCSKQTHNAIHYGDQKQAPKLFAERYENDQCPWR